MSQQHESGGTLGGRLRDLRQQSRITQRALATALGVGPPSVSSYENDSLVPPPSRMRGLATFFSLDRAAATQFGILVRVPVLLGRASTPNLQDDHARLYEWSDADDPAPTGEA